MTYCCPSSHPVYCGWNNEGYAKHYFSCVEDIQKCSYNSQPFDREQKPYRRLCGLCKNEFGGAKCNDIKYEIDDIKSSTTKSKYQWWEINKPPYVILAGGTYAPPHQGHLNNWTKAIDFLVENVEGPNGKNIEYEDIVLMVKPVNDKYKKGSLKFFNFEKRKELIELLIQDIDQKYQIQVDHYQKGNPDNKTIIDISSIKNRYGVKPIVLFGADNILGLLNQGKGKGWGLTDDKLKELTTNVVFLASCSTDEQDKRGHCNQLNKMFNDKMGGKNFNSTLIPFPIDISETSISSTEINECFRTITRGLTDNQIKKLLEYQIEF